MIVGASGHKITGAVEVTHVRVRIGARVETLTQHEAQKLCDDIRASLNGEPTSESGCIAVLGMGGLYLGDARTFALAKKMQLDHIPKELHQAYAGIGQDGQCLFYEEHLTEELKTKYKIGERPLTL